MGFLLGAAAFSAAVAFAGWQITQVIGDTPSTAIGVALVLAVIATTICWPRGSS